MQRSTCPGAGMVLGSKAVQRQRAARLPCLEECRPMFKRVLIANRGEIAIRIARAAASLGVDTVAVFTPADSLSLHTRLADKAREIGGRVTDPVRGYLDIDAVIAAAKDSGSDC